MAGAILALSLLGLADAVFVMAERVAGGPIPCVIGTGCDTVANSPYSLLFGIPLTVYGIVFYIAVGVLALLYLDTKASRWVRILLPVAGAGFAMSLYFIYIQKFLIGAFCVYCVVSAIIAILIFCATIALHKKA